MFEYRTWEDLMLMGDILQLRDGSRYVELCVTREEQIAAIDYRALTAAKMQLLADKWNETYGGNVVAVPPESEGQMWGFRYDDVIEGEIVEERRAIDAPRKAIEGR